MCIALGHHFTSNFDNFMLVLQRSLILEHDDWETEPLVFISKILQN